MQDLVSLMNIMHGNIMAISRKLEERRAHKPPTKEFEILKSQFEAAVNAFQEELEAFRQYELEIDGPPAATKVGLPPIDPDAVDDFGTF